tara:strand:- start:2737 stop:3525 length:789 start_codon:yes stop_codon:yes gene_type:complete
MSKKLIANLHTYITDEKPSEKELLEKIKELAYSNDPADRTITARYSLFKKHVREVHPKYTDDFLKTVAPPRELTLKVIGDNQVKRNAKKLVEFDKDIVDKLLSWRTDESPFKRMAFLQFVSGRRVNEIYDNEIGGLPRKNDRSVKMKLSKKNKQDTDKFFTFELVKDAGIDNKEFRKELSSTRKALTGIDSAAFAQRMNKLLKRDLRSDLSSHDLRSMYAVYRFNTENDEKQNITGYIGKILNHADGGDSGIAYSNFTYKTD